MRTSDRRHQWAALLVAGIVCSLLATSSLQRDWLNYSTETDFLGGFLPEAERFVAGEPLRLEFHPPLYSIALAATFAAVPDRMEAALWISLVAMGTALASTWTFVSFALDKPAGWAAMLGLAVSPTFLTYAGYATSDLFFLGLYSLTLALAAAAFRRDSAGLWLGAGLACGTVLLTRSNGLVLLSLVALPLLSRGTVTARLRRSASVLVGIGLIVVAWTLYARSTGSPIAPAGNHLNVALTYFAPGEDRISGDARLVIESRFESLADVLTHDPAGMLRTYVFDLARVKYLRSRELIPPLLAFPCLLGALLMLVRRRGDALWWSFVAITVLHVLLINLKAYEHRYHLFVVPMLFASGAAALGGSVRLPSNARKPLLIAGIAVVMSAGIYYARFSSGFAIERFHRHDGELASAVALIEPYLDGKERVVMLSRKPHVPHYVGVESSTLPNSVSIDALIDELDELDDGIEGGQLYIFYGAMERQFRSQFRDLDTYASSFSKVLEDGGTDGWALYRFVPPHS